MSFISNDSSIVKQKATGTLFTSVNAKAAEASSIDIFNKSLPDAEETAVDTVEKQEEVSRDFDIDELVKKYKKDPSKVFDILGINFTDEQKAQLVEIVNDKKSLKSFLEIAKNNALSSGDIVAGMIKATGKETSGFFKRIGNFFKTAVKEGVSEAVKLAKSEKVYYADKLGSNMNEVREEREDFTSKGVADVAEAVTDNPEIKDSTIHFVTKNETTGKKLYTETDVTKAVNIMKEEPEKADKFCANAVELESIKDSNNNIKYKGSTIINVSDRMTEKSELKHTMMAVAKKSDMTDETLDGTTENLFKNPNMENSVLFCTKAKNEDGTDKFSATQVCSTSEHLVNKEQSYCENYASNVEELSLHKNLSSEKILSTTQKVTECPQNKSLIYSELNLDKKQTNNVNSSNSKKERVIAVSAEKENRSQTTSTLPWQRNIKNDDTSAQTISIDGKDYPRNSVLQVLKSKYGSSVAEMMLSKMENNPKFIDYVKEFGAQKDIIEALLKDKNKVKKLKNASASIDNTKLSEMLKLASNETNTKNLIAFSQKFSVSTAIKMTKESKFNNIEEETASILSKSTMDNSTKKEKIEELLSGGNKKAI